jgi:4-nitrophenyl phosphatase
MSQYKAFCFDLDGTVYRGKEPISSAIKFIQQLEERHLDYFIVTNNASKTPAQLKETLSQMGLKVREEQIYTSALVAAKYVKQQFGQAKIFMIGQDGLRHALQSQQIELTEENPDVVVMGIDQQINYEKLSKACVAVQRGATLIGTNGDVKIPSENGFHPGNGSFVNLVANVCGVKPIFLGKPRPIMLEMIAADFQLKKEEIIMIGDNYDTDIMCGIQYGCDTIHVNTGVINTELVKEKEIQPTYLVNDLSEFEL